MPDNNDLTARIITTDDLAARVRDALELAAELGGTDNHHQTWVVDQMVRALTGDDYDEWVAETCDGEEGPDSYSWEIGSAP